MLAKVALGKFPNRAGIRRRAFHLEASMFDRAKYFAAIRPLFGSLTAAQVAGQEAILDEWQRRKLTDVRWLAYMLATTFHETGKAMAPVREGGRGKGKAYGVADATTHQVYYGRGFVQLTWRDNYSKMTQLLGVDLIHNPDLALRLATASAIMFEGMMRGTFTGKKLGDFFGAGKDDPVNARTIINGHDHADKIAGYHARFLAALNAADVATPTSPVQLPVPTTAPVDKADAKQAASLLGGSGVLAGAAHWFAGATWLHALIVLLLAAAAYWFLLRPIMRRLAVLQDFYARADALELSLVDRVRLALKGMRTLLWGRFVALAGVAIGLLQLFDITDFTTLLQPVYGVPAAVYVPLLLSPVIGWVTNKLRTISNTAAGATDLATVEAPPAVAPQLPDIRPALPPIVPDGAPAKASARRKRPARAAKRKAKAKPRARSRKRAA
jgi:putative chitinase